MAVCILNIIYFFALFKRQGHSHSVHNVKSVEIFIDTIETLVLTILMTVLTRTPVVQKRMTCCLAWYALVMATDLVFYLALILAKQMFMSYGLAIATNAVKLALFAVLRLY